MPRIMPSPMVFSDADSLTLDDAKNPLVLYDKLEHKLDLFQQMGGQLREPVHTFEARYGYNTDKSDTLYNNCFASAIGIFIHGDNRGLVPGNLKGVLTRKKRVYELYDENSGMLFYKKSNPAKYTCAMQDGLENDRIRNNVSIERIENVFPVIGMTYFSGAYVPPVDKRNVAHPDIRVDMHFLVPHKASDLSFSKNQKNNDMSAYYTGRKSLRGDLEIITTKKQLMDTRLNNRVYSADLYFVPRDYMGKIIKFNM